MTPCQFHFRSVSKVYDGPVVLSDVSFTITAGEHTAILGPSGCGKSTVLRLLAGLEAPSAGEILCDGKTISESNRILTPPHLRGVAMVFQDLAIWPNLSVMGNVLLGLTGMRLSSQQARIRAEEALALCGIQQLADRKPGTLSGGQQQRAALARAIAAQPAFLLLDEPFSGLDLVTKNRLLREIADLATQRNLTVLLVSHDPMEATALCRSAILLDNGHVQEIGALENLLRAPQSEMLTVFRDYLRRLPSGT
jgi:ABC-type Fe3+/spermidine/putrescine transport system ATPase subunit